MILFEWQSLVWLPALIFMSGIVLPRDPSTALSIANFKSQPFHGIVNKRRSDTCNDFSIVPNEMVNNVCQGGGGEA